MSYYYHRQGIPGVWKSDDIGVVAIAYWVNGSNRLSYTIKCCSPKDSFMKRRARTELKKNVRQNLFKTICVGYDPNVCSGETLRQYVLNDLYATKLVRKPEKKTRHIMLCDPSHFGIFKRKWPSFVKKLG